LSQEYQDVGPLVEGPDNVYICGECVPLCLSILDQEKRRRNLASGHLPVIGVQNLRETLDKLVTNHEAAKAALAEAAFGQREGKGRILLIGPSQSCQMFLAKALAHALEVPFAAGDARGLAKLESANLLHDLLVASDFDVASAQRGVIFVGGAEQQDMQDALLRLWHENISYLGDKLPIEVRGILFVCGGTFPGLDEAIGRLGRHVEQPVTSEPLAAAGARADWACSFAAIARVAPLDEADLARIVHCVDFRRIDNGTAT
jgi:ATP-dependent Clp protease ATP-binding subunit ClpX